MLVPATNPLPDFPYTPGWLPGGVAGPSVQLHGGLPDLPDLGIIVEHAAEQDRSVVLIQVRILSPEEADARRPDGPSGENLVVRGAPAVLTGDGRWLSVTWTDPSGQVVQVGASNLKVGRDALLRYVEELVETGGGRLALSISFTPDLMVTIHPWRQDRESLLAFAEGVALTPYASPAPFTVRAAAGQ